MRKEGVHDLRQLPRAGIADDRAVQAREAGPVDVDRALGLAFVFVAADQRDRVAAARVRDGHTGVRGRGDAHRDAGYDFEAHAVFVQK